MSSVNINDCVSFVSYSGSVILDLITPSAGIIDNGVYTPLL